MTDAFVDGDNRLRIERLAVQALLDRVLDIEWEPPGDRDAPGERHADRAVAADELRRQRHAVRAGSVLGVCRSRKQPAIRRLPNGDDDAVAHADCRVDRRSFLRKAVAKARSGRRAQRGDRVAVDIDNFEMCAATARGLIENLASGGPGGGHEAATSQIKPGGHNQAAERSRRGVTRTEPHTPVSYITLPIKQPAIRWRWCAPRKPPSIRSDRASPFRPPAALSP